MYRASNLSLYFLNLIFWALRMMLQCSFGAQFDCNYMTFDNQESSFMHLLWFLKNPQSSLACEINQFCKKVHLSCIFWLRILNNATLARNYFNLSFRLNSLKMSTFSTKITFKVVEAIPSISMYFVLVKCFALMYSVLLNILSNVI